MLLRWLMRKTTVESGPIFASPDASADPSRTRKSERATARAQAYPTRK